MTVNRSEETKLDKELEAFLLAQQQYHSNYHDHKERMAWVATALFAAYALSSIKFILDIKLEGEIQILLPYMFLVIIAIFGLTYRFLRFHFLNRRTAEVRDVFISRCLSQLSRKHGLVIRGIHLLDDSPEFRSVVRCNHSDPLTYLTSRPNMCPNFDNTRLCLPEWMCANVWRKSSESDLSPKVTERLSYSLCWFLFLLHVPHSFFWTQD